MGGVAYSFLKIRALGICPEFTDAQTCAWYDANPDLFTRYPMPDKAKK